MVSRRLASIFTLSVILTGISAGPVFAGDWNRHHHRHGGHHHHHHGHGRIDGEMHSGLPSILPGIGTYSGAISALRVRGHGIYFSATGLGRKEPARPRPKATIIDVSSGVSDPCHYEAGVCVIRP